MTYKPNHAPKSPDGLLAYVAEEFRRVSLDSEDTTPRVLYRTLPANQESLTAGVSANWKIAYGNVIRVSTSATITLTGLAYKVPQREMILLNVGTGVITLLSESTASSASYRFALASTLNISANAAVTLWYDSYSARHRAIAKT